MYILSHCGSDMKTLLTCTYVSSMMRSSFVGILGTPGRKDPHRTTDISFHSFESPGGRTPNPRVPKSQKMQTSSRWRHMYNKEK